MKERTRKLKSRNRSHWLKLREMPPLSHYPDRSQPFELSKSEVIKHIMTVCEVDMQRADALRVQASRLRVIVFDTATKLWRGNQDWLLSNNHEETHHENERD